MNPWSGKRMYLAYCVSHLLTMFQVLVPRLQRPCLSPPSKSTHPLICHSLFRPMQIRAHGAFQDGGLRQNNPVNIGLSEIRQIWPASSSVDVVLSLGTGLSGAESPRASHFRHIFNDGFIPRLYRSFLSSFDGESAWRDLHNRLDNDTIGDYFRFNVKLDTNPLLHDTSCMDQLRDRVRKQSIETDRKRLVSALLIASFFFELTDVPCFENGIFQCDGVVRSRTPSYATVAAMERFESTWEFVTDTGALCLWHGRDDICQSCHRYAKRLTFYVRDLSDPVSISLRAGHTYQRRISGFPQCMTWFVQQQQLDAVFGSADHGQPGQLKCSYCDTNASSQKRCRTQSMHQPQKRIRHTL